MKFRATESVFYLEINFTIIKSNHFVLAFGFHPSAPRPVAFDRTRRGQIHFAAFTQAAQMAPVPCHLIWLGGGKLY